MEQRPLRLGDILDDYCPRERRVTNHAIVAMIEDDVRQTRCTTCDAEHAYKGAKAPRTRAKKGTPAALYKEVLAGMPEAVEPPPVLTPVVRASEAAVQAPDEARDPEAVRAVVRDAPALVEPLPLSAAEHAVPPPVDVMPPAERSPVEEGPVHRPLIRATLPRTEGQKEARPIPDFTMRQPLARGRFRGGEARVRFRGNGNGNGNGNGHGNGNGGRSHAGSRFGNQRPGGRRRRGR